LTPSLFLFLLLLFSFSFIFLQSSSNLHYSLQDSKTTKVAKNLEKKEKQSFFLKKNANQEDGTSFPPRKSYFKKTNSNKVFLKKHLLDSLVC